ncbi:MAG: 3-hydroxyacyl-CoA dehydrogenase NAD-binding domain-containing protein [Candidatus Thermoplasmatota archaeon]|nr:3-hydroxyacyl-CoA dehydrogenase NAD-binding domain-containing protein [Candidatus Thermoplasmatota archaeon]
MAVRSVGVVGSGQMGNGIAQVAACSGKEVMMVDIKEEFLERGVSTISNSLHKLASKGRITDEQATSALSRISTSVSMDALSECDLIVEAIPEIPELKFSTFSQLDSICKPAAIQASNTSSISINEIASHTSRADRVIGMHFMNPVPIMKLVEVINGEETSEEVTSEVISASEEMGKTPLSCMDSPGFVSNRILMPMINEAILTLQEGVAEPDAIDGIMKLGMNHPIGPLALADLIGLDTVMHILNVLEEGMEDDKYAPAGLLVEKVSKGELGRKSGSGFYHY